MFSLSPSKTDLLSCCLLTFLFLASFSAVCMAKQQQRLGGSALPAHPAHKKGASSDDDPAYAAFVKGHYFRALKLAQIQAHKGEAQAFTLIGRLYANGLGLARNMKIAAKWYAAGARRGDMNAQFALAMQLTSGDGIRQDLKRAADLFTAAAVQGHALAQYNLGLVYASGRGRPQNMEKAASWFKKAALQGEMHAQYDLGTLYQEGSGVPLDQKKAAKWIGLAANAGLDTAQLDYGLILYLGKGVPKNHKKGALYLLRAARQGNPVAQNRVAKLYAHGLVFKQDLIEAAKWHLIARSHGVSDIRLDLKIARLPKAQRQLAEKKARLWQRLMLSQ